MQHQGTQTLETERLILRRFTRDDAEAMFANWAGDPEVTRFLTWPTHPSADATRQLLTDWEELYQQPDYYTWGLELKTIGQPIGSLSVVRMDEGIAEAELGWCMGHAWWGRGLMPEAARAVVRYLFEAVGFNRICAKHDTNNPKSGRVMQKIGMDFEGVSREGGRNNCGIVDMAHYALLARDYLSKRG